MSLDDTKHHNTSLLNHLPDDTLHTCSFGASLRLLRSKGHYSPELFTMLGDQVSNDSSYVIITKLRRLQVCLENIQLPLFFLRQVIPSPLLIQWNSLVAFLRLLFEHSHTLSLGKRLSIFRIFPVGTRHFNIVNCSYCHAER